MTAPIGHTCPDIDTAKKRLLDLVQYVSDEVTPQTLRHINRESDHIDDALEKLRTSNETLRSWGESCEEERDTLQDQLDEVIQERDQRETLLLALASVTRLPGLDAAQRLAAIEVALSEGGYKAKPQTNNNAVGEAPAHEGESR